MPHIGRQADNRKRTFLRLKTSTNPCDSKCVAALLDEVFAATGGPRPGRAARRAARVRSNLAASSHPARDALRVARAAVRHSTLRGNAASPHALVELQQHASRDVMCRCDRLAVDAFRDLYGAELTKFVGAANERSPKAPVERQKDALTVGSYRRGPLRLWRPDGAVYRLHMAPQLAYSPQTLKIAFDYSALTLSTSGKWHGPMQCTGQRRRSAGRFTIIVGEDRQHAAETDARGPRCPGHHHGWLPEAIAAWPDDLVTIAVPFLGVAEYRSCPLTWRSAWDAVDLSGDGVMFATQIGPTWTGTLPELLKAAAGVGAAQP